MNKREEPNNKRSLSEQVGENIRIYKRGTVWHATFQHNGKQKRMSLKTGSKKEARRKAILIDADVISGRYTATRPPSIETVIREYRNHLETEKRSPKTIGKYDHAFEKVRDLARRRKVRTIMGIDLSFIDAFRAERVADGAAPKTVHNDTTTIRQLINFARRRGMIQEDPLRGLKLPKPKTTPQPCWTKAQVSQIIPEATEPQRSILTVLSETGTRIGELKYLTWDDVDFDNNVIHIRPKPGWKPKTGDIRAIPMSALARGVLERLPRKCRWVFTAAPSRKHPRGDGQVSERRLLQYLKRILRRLGLPGHLHTFRHSFISTALTAGIPEAVVRRWVGHVDRDIMDLYTHIADTASQAAMSKLAEQAGGVPADDADRDGGAKDIGSAQSQHKPEEDQNDVSAK